MRLLTLLASAALALGTLAAASIDSVAQTLTTSLGGIVQTCPPGYAQGVCLRADGSVVQTAARIDALNPGLIPDLWRNGPEDGLSADIPSETALIHLLPQTENQVIVVLQPQGSATPAVTVVPASTDLIVENPENNYVVILDNANQPVRNWASVRDGTYTVIVSNYNRATHTQTLQVDKQGLKTLRVPKLSVKASPTEAGGLTLPSAPEYIFLILTASGNLVTDVSTLTPGYYDIFSYKAGEAGPLASLQRVQARQLTTLNFNSTFARPSSAVQPSPTPPAVVSPTYSAPTAAPAPSAPSSGQCYVSGYTRKNGTYVSGYYRRC
jgi:hypothetical protein